MALDPMDDKRTLADIAHRTRSPLLPKAVPGVHDEALAHLGYFDDIAEDVKEVE